MSFIACEKSLQSINSSVVSLTSFQTGLFPVSVSFPGSELVSLFFKKPSSVETRQAVNKLRVFVQTREKVSNRHEAMCRMSEAKFASVMCFRSSLALIGWFRLWKSPLLPHVTSQMGKPPRGTAGTAVPLLQP